MKEPTDELLKHLISRCGLKDSAQFRRPLADLTTLGVGGPVQALVESNELEKLSRLLLLLEQHSIPWRVLGGGTNILGDDRGIPGVVLRLRPTPPVRLEETGIKIGGGASLARAVEAAAESSLSGLEFCTGIPGTVGGAVAMNAGTGMKWLSSVLKTVSILRPGQKAEEIPAGACGFGYRASNLRNKNLVITEAFFLLTPAARTTIYAAMEKTRKKRRQTIPEKNRSAGCWFRNPPGASAGRLIEAAGLKGEKRGRAEISDLHGNFLINVGGATSRDISSLAAYIQEKVLMHSGIKLEAEVELWS